MELLSPIDRWIGANPVYGPSTCFSSLRHEDRRRRMCSMRYLPIKAHCIPCQLDCFCPRTICFTAVFDAATRNIVQSELPLRKMLNLVIQRPTQAEAGLRGGGHTASPPWRIINLTKTAVAQCIFAPPYPEEKLPSWLVVHDDHANLQPQAPISCSLSPPHPRLRWPHDHVGGCEGMLSCKLALKLPRQSFLFLAL